MKALIVDEPWISLILKGEKIWEMRKTRCKIRERVGLIRKGSGCVVGTVEVGGSRPAIMTSQEYAAAERQHRIPPNLQGQTYSDGWTTPWILSNARPLPRPIRYKHPNGAVIWVTLDPEVAAQLEAHTP